jgi:fructokinase
MLFGGIEGGGTKFVCAISTANGEVLDSITLPTTDPQPTIQQAITFFKQSDVMRAAELAAIGIGTFGPVDLNPSSGSYGFITRTPKPGWADTDIVGPVRAAFPGLPVGFDTDVNAAALGEQRWGAAQDWDTFIYLTVGTGIGGGGMVGGQMLHGLIHSEMGHITLPLHPDDPMSRGVCPYHPACLEGLASGTAIRKRWGTPGQDLAPDHPAWDLEAHYLALAVANFMCTLSPQGVILGGSVMHQHHLFPLVREKTRALLNGYLAHPRLDTMTDYIVPPGLGDRAGVLGSVAVGMVAYEARAQVSPRRS